MTSKKIQVSEMFLFAGAFTASVWAVYFSIVTLFIPYQIEFREGAGLVLTEILLHGGNPFSFKYQPLAMNNYGIGYNLVVLPFAALFGNTLLVYRAVTFLFIVLSAILGFIVVYKNTKSGSLSLACSAFIMNGLIGYGGIGAFPAALGLFLFFLATLFPFMRSFDWTSLILSIFVSLFAFYTKPYFVLSFGVVSSYLFLFVSKKKSVFYGLAFLTLFALSLLLMGRLFPLYFINTVVGNESNASMSTRHLFNQLHDIWLFFYPVLLLSVAGATLQWWGGRSKNKSGHGGLFNLSVWDAPLFHMDFGFLFYSFVCCLLAFVFILGPHKGTYLTYALQLLVPTFFCCFFFEFGRLQKIKILAIVLVLFNLGTLEKTLLNSNALKQKNSREWIQVYEYLHDSSLTLNSPAVTSGILDIGQLPMDSGQTSYFYAVQPFSKNLLTRVAYDDFHDDGFQYTRFIDNMIKKQMFDLVITTKEKATFYHTKTLPEYYQPVDEIKVTMPQIGEQWTLVFWKRLVK